MNTFALIDGESFDSVSIVDRGFAYGHGVFETIRVVNSKLILLDEHLQRLQLGCLRLSIPARDGFQELLREEAIHLANIQCNGIIKLVITAGVGGRGYESPQNTEPTRVVARFDLTDYPKSYYDKGVVVRTCDYRLPRNPALTGIKHLNRLDQILARAEWNDSAIAEGIMLDQNDFVVEGTKSNIFAVISGEIFTPSLEECGVRGVMRDHIIEFLGAEGLALSEALLSEGVLKQADELFLCNSVFGVWPVSAWEGSTFTIGPVTQRCQQHCDQLFHY